MTTEVDEVMFDVLLRSAGSGHLPHTDNIHEFYVSSDDIEHCRRWFAERDIILHTTPFGLSGSATREQFETIFAAKLAPIKSVPGQLNYRLLVGPKPPAELTEMIDQITVTTSPAFF